VLREAYFHALLVAVALVNGATAQALEPTIGIFVETPLRPVIRGSTNLPDGTELMLTLLRPESGYMAQSKTRVLAGHFGSERFSANGNPLNPGKYQVRIITIAAELQTKAVQSVIGAHGERLSGTLIKPSPLGGSMLEYVAEVQLGGPPNTVLDAKAKAASDAALQRRVVQSCEEAVDLANAGVKSGMLTGHVISGVDREQRVSECILKANNPPPNNR
jgi:hypothetical protein